MLREQEIMKRIVDEIGEEFDDYIDNFYICDLWKIKEGELLVNKTFKKVIDIVAEYNLTTTNLVLENAYHLIEANEVMLKLLDYMTNDFIHNGSKSLLNQCMTFCYTVFIITRINNKKAIDVLKDIINSELIYTKETLWGKILYILKVRPRPYKIDADKDAIMLISLLKGNSAKEVLYSLVEYKELI